MAPTHIFQPLSDPAGDNGEAITALFKKGGPGTTVLLVPAALYVLKTTIWMSHDNTTLATQHYPAFETGQQAILETRGEREAGAVHLYNLSNATLKRVHINGCRGWGRRKPESKEEEERLRKAGNLGWIEGGGSLVWMGGPNSHDALVEGCRLEDPRGWTACHVCDWGIRPRVIGNLVGPCGQEAMGGPWADGLSVAGKDAVIIGNTVFDATDGAIVVFCAPGSLIANNTIIAKTRDLLGAINMVDDFPYDRDFTNTRVIGNSIIAKPGAYIRLAIGIGPTCWSPFKDWHKINHSGHVLNNYLGPGHIGYGIALSGAKDFTVQGNVVMPNTSFIGDTGRILYNAPPTAFLTEWSDRNRTEGCNLQEEFVEGEASWLIGVESGVGARLDYQSGQLKLRVDGTSHSGEGGVRVRGARYEVSPKGDLLLREELAENIGKIGVGRVLWSNGHSSHSTPAVRDPILEFSKEGQVTIKSEEKILWDPTAYFKPYFEELTRLPPLVPPKKEQYEGRPKFIFDSEKPYVTFKDGRDNVIFSSSYEYHRGRWEIHSGMWIALMPTQLRGTTEGLQHHEEAAPPSIPTSNRPHFGEYIKDLSREIIDAHSHHKTSPPPRPPSPAPTTPPSLPLPRTTFFFLNPLTHQLTLHSSKSPAHPTKEDTHWVSTGPVDAESSWLVFQGDGNAVLYAKKGDHIFVPWSTGTNGDNPALRLVLKGEGEEGGPAVEFYDGKGACKFTSNR